jgi:protein ImuB
MKSYAVLFAPEFRLQAVLRHQPTLAGKPVALVESAPGAKPLVVELNAAARALTVEPGMTPTQALARCTTLHLLAPHAAQERSAQDALLQTAGTLSPFLESTAPGVVTIELPPERAFSEADLARRTVAPLQGLGLEVQVGVAGTPDLAWLAARFATPVRLVTDAAEFLAPLPLAALAPGEALAAVLDSWGIRTVGQLRALPAAEMWERLGPEAVALGERAAGGSPRPLRLVKPPEFFAESADLDHAVETLEPLLFLLRRFLEQIAAQLACAHYVAGRLRLVLRFERDAPYQRIFTIPHPTREVDLLFRLLHTHLENFTSESPIVGVDLAAKAVRPQVRQIDLLDRGLRDPHQFAETLARLQALLGPGEVGTPQLDSSHHPDAFALRPYDPEAPAPGADERLVGLPCLRFRPPVAARVILNESGPAFLYSPPTTGPIRETRGPWRLAGHWWQHDRQWEREEWDIATADGFYRLVQAGAHWFIDGIYA